MKKLNKNENGFGALEGLLIVVILAVIGFVGWYVYKTNRDISNNSKDTPSSTQQNAVKSYTIQDSVALVQKSYDTYLDALVKGNESNNANPSSTNKTLQQIGLEAVKVNLTPQLYTKMNKDESSAPFPDEFGCVKYLPDKYSASVKSSDKSNTLIDVVILGSGGNNQGTISVGVNTNTLKISSVICPQ